MNERTANPVAPRGPASTRIVFAIVAMIAAFVHVRAAQVRSSGLLDHDEAISLLAAAGKSDQALLLYGDQSADPPVVRSAAALQSLLQPTGETGFADVLVSLRDRDIHPPLYFWLLHAAQRCGVHSEMWLRLLGSMMLLLSAVIMDRGVWPQSRVVLRLLAFATLLLSPTLIATAIELRQYALLFLGISVSLAAIVRCSDSTNTPGLNAVLIGIAPSLLIWTHLGSAIWIAIWGATLLVVGGFAGPAPRKSLVVGIPLAALLAALLAFLLRGSWGDRVHPGFEVTSLASAAFHVLANAVRPLVSMPWQWQGSWIAVLPMFAAIALAIGLMVRRPTRVDLGLLAASLLWLIAWIGLLAAGKLPPHAIGTKYLLAPALALLAVLIRSCRPETPSMTAGFVIVVAWCCLLTHLAGLPSVLRTPGDATIAAQLRDVRTVFVNDPKRGYLLPIVDKLPADAKLCIMRPLRMPSELASIAEPLLVVEVKPLPGYPSSDEAERLNEFLSSQHERREVLADGPRRRLTLYRHRRSNAPAFGTD